MAMQLLQAWEQTVAREPGARAVIEAADGRVWSRRALADAAGAWRAGVAADVVRRRVAMAEPKGAGWWQVFLGLLEAGAVPALLDTAEPPERQREIARAIGAGWLWRAGRLEALGSVRAARARRGGLIKLTSGSTGAPRALVFTDEQMLADGRQVCATMGIRGDDLNLAAIPLGHSYGLGNLVLPLLQQGTAMVCAASPLPQALAADCARHRPTVFPAVPALLEALVRADVAPAALASLRQVISAGAPLRAEAAAAFAARFGRRVHNFYGATETGGICFDRTGAATQEGRSVGTPLEGVTLEFGAGGRFAVRSAAAQRGRFRPADHGRLNEHGELVLFGRAGRMVKIAARRVDLGEIERALRSVPGVRDAYAMAHPQRAEAIAAAVASELAPEEIRTQLARRLAGWKVPERLVVLPELPLSARGKHDTRQLGRILGALERTQGSTPKSK